MLIVIAYMDSNFSRIPHLPVPNSENKSHVIEIVIINRNLIELNILYSWSIYYQIQ